MPPYLFYMLIFIIYTMTILLIYSYIIIFLTFRFQHFSDSKQK
ncbi:hypothetical protein PITCH_A510008 [uncultured Desulfobacterium sp.]|uniref:Uncharacterized protein n=1 Tax=uncultured Desulfobacterium sp. TaxID=201089 RepID=A0A445N0R6_9BACT|nr:hypothetical protein PITCH_A510008 [uncultured Desulfobacterium sp.]